MNKKILWIEDEIYAFKSVLSLKNQISKWML